MYKNVLKSKLRGAVMKKDNTKEINLYQSNSNKRIIAISYPYLTGYNFAIGDLVRNPLPGSNELGFRAHHRKTFFCTCKNEVVIQARILARQLHIAGDSIRVISVPDGEYEKYKEKYGL